jgi:ketosteroid isomerase-like protein
MPPRSRAKEPHSRAQLIECAQEFLEVRTRGDLTRLNEMLDDNVSFEILRDPERRTPKPVSGFSRDSFVTMTGSFTARYASEDADILACVVDGDRVGVMRRVDFVDRGSGAPMTTYTVDFMTFKWGRVAHVRNIAESADGDFMPPAKPPPRAGRGSSPRRTR